MVMVDRVVLVWKRLFVKTNHCCCTFPTNVVH